MITYVHCSKFKKKGLHNALNLKLSNMGKGPNLHTFGYLILRNLFSMFKNNGSDIILTISTDKFLKAIAIIQ
jgi:hypothetical protein